MTTFPAPYAGGKSAVAAAVWRYGSASSSRATTASIGSRGVLRNACSLAIVTSFSRTALLGADFRPDPERLPPHTDDFFIRSPLRHLTTDGLTKSS